MKFIYQWTFINSDKALNITLSIRDQAANSIARWHHDQHQSATTPTEKPAQCPFLHDDRMRARRSSRRHLERVGFAENAIVYSISIAHNNVCAYSFLVQGPLAQSTKNIFYLHSNKSICAGMQIQSYLFVRSTFFLIKLTFFLNSNTWPRIESHAAGIRYQSVPAEEVLQCLDSSSHFYHDPGY